MLMGWGGVGGVVDRSRRADIVKYNEMKGKKDRIRKWEDEEERWKGEKCEHIGEEEDEKGSFFSIDEKGDGASLTNSQNSDVKDFYGNSCLFRNNTFGIERRSEDFEDFECDNDVNCDGCYDENFDNYSFDYDDRSLFSNKGKLIKMKMRNKRSLPLHSVGEFLFDFLPFPHLQLQEEEQQLEENIRTGMRILFFSFIFFFILFFFLIFFFF
jgi:hypothetical protein